MSLSIFGSRLSKCTTSNAIHSKLQEPLIYIGYFTRSCRRSSSVQIFDRDLKARQREYALRIPDGDYYDYLREESASNLVDRLEDITRTFPNTLELGSYRGSILKTLRSKPNFNGVGSVGGITKFVQSDLMEPVTPKHDPTLATSNVLPSNEVTTVICGSSEVLPFEHHSFDLILSSLMLHWVNDLPQYLLQIRNVLKPDGAFIGSLLGGNTLKELRYCFYLAEQERTGGVSPHVSPLVKSSDVAALMQSAGFALPTVDVDVVTISYPDAFTLMEHLAHMGESNAAFNRQYPVHRDTFLSMASIYQDMFGLEDGSVTATFEIIYVIGWSPAGTQPQACKRGSASASIKDISNLK